MFCVLNLLGTLPLRRKRGTAGGSILLQRIARDSFNPVYTVRYDRSTVRRRSSNTTIDKNLEPIRCTGPGRP